jgi:hypothetical protein
MGSYQDNFGSTLCLFAQPGHFVEFVGQSREQPCDLGTYQPDAGQSSCILAEIGTYVNITGATQSTACSKGTFRESVGGATCQLAESGSYVPTEGSSEQTACPIGTYQPDFGSSECLEVPFGTYANEAGLAQPIPCLRASTTNVLGAISVEECVPDWDNDGVPDSLDEDDDDDGLNDDEDACQFSDVNEFIYPNGCNDADVEAISADSDFSSSGMLVIILTLVLVSLVFSAMKFRQVSAQRRFEAETVTNITIQNSQLTGDMKLAGLMNDHSTETTSWRKETTTNLENHDSVVMMEDEKN